MNAHKPANPSKRGIGSRFAYKFKRFIRYIGLHKRVIVMPDGVRYRERSGVSLRRALSDHGPGVKEYETRFPWIDSEGRRGMRIRYTTSRLYGDVGYDPRSILYTQVLSEITPGLRVLEIGCGTGTGTSILTHAVGPSGGVVAIDRDGESIRFARQRYLSDHCGFELGWIETLDGEIDGGFDAVVAVDPLRGATNAPEQARAITEIARVVAPGGWLVLINAQPAQSDLLDGLTDGFKTLGFDRTRSLARCPRSGWTGVLCSKPGLRKSPPPSDHRTPGSFQS